MLRPLLASFVVAFALVLGAGCATPLKLSPTSRSPSTDAFLKVSADANDNSILTVEAQHLPPPERLGPGLKTYVVWVVSTDGAFVSNVGMLRVDDQQNGSLTATTPLREFLVRITAEQGGTAIVPSQLVVVEGAARR